MPRIVFTADPKLPRDLAHLGYRKDQEVELPGDQCERWIRRGVAKYIQAAPVVAEAPAPEQKPSSGKSGRIYGRGHPRATLETPREPVNETPKEGEAVTITELPKEPDLV